MGSGSGSGSNHGVWVRTRSIKRESPVNYINFLLLGVSDPKLRKCLTSCCCVRSARNLKLCKTCMGECLGNCGNTTLAMQDLIDDADTGPEGIARLEEDLREAVIDPKPSNLRGAFSTVNFPGTLRHPILEHSSCR